MKTKNFLELLLADEGHYCVFAAKGGSPKQSFYNSVDDVLDAAHGYDADGYDVYFALATLETAGSRKADNVRGMKSFFLDLDCGEGKEFPTKRLLLWNYVLSASDINCPILHLLTQGAVFMFIGFYPS